MANFDILETIQEALDSWEQTKVDSGHDPALLERGYEILRDMGVI